MEILRIPTHYRSQMEYISDSDRGYILLCLLRLSEGEIIEVEKSMRGGTVISIWKEACQLEKKARKGKGEDYFEVEPVISYDIPGGLPLRVTPEVYPEIHPNPTQINPNQTKSNQPIDEDLEKIINFWNTELNRKYEITKELKDSYSKIKNKYDRGIIEDVVLSYIDKCKKMDKQYHLSPFKFFTQKNGFITIKNS